MGSNLQNHLCARLQYAVSEPITAYRTLHPWNAAKEILRYALFRKGIFSQISVATGGFFRSDDCLEIPDMQAQMAMGLIGNVGKSAWSRLPRRHGFSIAINQGRPFLRGAVRLRSAKPADAPLIMPRYFSDRRDLDILMRGERRMREIVNQGEIRRVISEELQPGPAADDDISLEAYLRQTCSNAFHPVGTCRMGGDAESVVDPQLRVRGISGLRVADAGIIPTLINGNTNAPAIMVGENAAMLIQSGHNGSSLQ